MIDFVKYRTWCAAFSLVIVLAFAGAYIYKWQTRGYTFTYSIDFTGGTQTLLKFDKPISSIKIKEILEKSGWQSVSTRSFSPEEVLVRVKNVETDVEGTAARMEQSIRSEIPDAQVTVLQTESVGPGVGEALRSKSIRAIIYALIAMLLYIAFRFWSFSFAIGAIVALFHDAIVMLAIFLIFDREISVNFVGAILMVLGYSINDTIVIFSQIRENLRTMKNISLRDLVNLSINQTLRRSILTSFTTALTVISILFLGGEALRDFALAFLIGIVFGTYSSIYIASPVMMMFYGKKS